MLSVPLALRLRDAGLRWKPAPGDRFAIPDRDLDDEVFVLSNMVIAVHELPDGPVIGFNGTTEWAMDDLEQSEAIWLPREDQLRELLGGTFHMLERAGTGYRVELSVGDRRLTFEAGTAEEAYGAALLDLIRLGVD
ncbi:pilus assembly protein CpaE [Asanoa siamensis]|uniref:pilus assembly protein CpaE n=1 Tax=Asanoa siamensis TaxID=926357 RepID=UPI00194061B1|nr:pilus assembly protein CpaE [Asanoa siamensis]